MITQKYLVTLKAGFDPVIFRSKLRRMGNASTNQNALQLKSDSICLHKAAGMISLECTAASANAISKWEEVTGVDEDHVVHFDPTTVTYRSSRRNPDGVGVVIINRDGSMTYID